MTVVVGYLAGNSDTGPLELGVEAARAMRTSLTVATVVPKPWAVPSQARVDAEYAAWADQLAGGSADEARRHLGATADQPETTYHSHANRSASDGLIEVVEELGAEMLVLGSTANGKPGYVDIGSTADPLLHSSPVPVAIAPRGYRGSRGGVLTRISCGYPAAPEAVAMVASIAGLAARLGVPLRVITFAVRGGTMYPPEIGLHAEDAVQEAWAEHARGALGQLRADGLVGEDVALQVVSGSSWAQALAAADWQDGEVLALGTSPRRGVARVFLGSRATKIVRHSPVPVLVLPG